MSSAQHIIQTLTNVRMKRQMPLGRVSLLVEKAGAHITESLLCRYEHGDHEPPLSKVCAWADALGFDLVLVRRQERGDMDKAIRRLREEYDHAMMNQTVRTPMAYALYHTWRWFDAKKKEEAHEGDA